MSYVYPDLCVEQYSDQYRRNEGSEAQKVFLSCIILFDYTLYLTHIVIDTSSLIYTCYRAGR
jgi:hypothetical protein